MDYHLVNEHQENLPFEKDLENKRKRRKQLYLGILAAVLFFVLAVLAVISYQALRHLSADPLTVAVSRLINLPAGFVEGQTVSYADFQEDWQAVNQFYEFQLSQNPTLALPSSEEVKKSVWERLLKNALIEKRAKETGVLVKAEEVDQEFEKVVKEIGSLDKAKEVLRQSYNFSPTQFKQKIIYPVLLGEKLRRASSTFENLEEYLNGELKKIKIWQWVKI